MGDPRPVVVSFVAGDHLALADFYRNAFGFVEVEAVRSPIFTALRTPTVVLGFHHDDAYELLGLDQRRGAVGGGVHVTFDVGSAADVDAMAPTLQELGAQLIKGPFTTYYQARQMVMADPEGNVFRVSDTQDALGVALRPDRAKGVDRRSVHG